MPDYSSRREYDPLTAARLFDESSWSKSYLSEPNGGNCVEVNRGVRGLVGLRDTKLADSPVFVYDSVEWNAFLGAVKAGRFDLPA